MATENILTRINYSPRGKGLLAAGFFGILAYTARSIERDPSRNTLPLWMKGHLFDLFTVPVTSSYLKIIVGEDNLKAEILASLLMAFTVELLQATSLNLDHGTFSPIDFVFYLAGVPIWLAFDGSAKKLYESGITKPIYRVMGIQDRRK